MENYNIDVILLLIYVLWEVIKILFNICYVKTYYTYMYLYMLDKIFLEYIQVFILIFIEILIASVDKITNIFSQCV